MFGKVGLLFLLLGICISVIQGAVTIDNYCRCGQLSSDRIKGGDDIFVDFVPWYAGIIYKKDQYEVHSKFPVFGAVIVSDKHVLTTNEVLKKIYKVSTEFLFPRKFEIAVGGDAKSDNFQRYQIKSVNRNPDNKAILSGKFYEHDLVLLELENKLTWSDKVRPVCLPQDNEDNNMYGGFPAVMTGFGDTKGKKKAVFPDTLQQVDVEIKSRTKCAKSLKDWTWYKSTAEKLSDNFLCTDHTQSKSSCSYDNGGPITRLRSYGEVLVGLIGTPFGCYTSYSPKAHPRVAPSLPWILKVLEDQGASLCKCDRQD